MDAQRRSYSRCRVLILTRMPRVTVLKDGHTVPPQRSPLMPVRKIYFPKTFQPANPLNLKPEAGNDLGIKVSENIIKH